MTRTDRDDGVVLNVHSCTYKPFDSAEGLKVQNPIVVPQPPSISDGRLHAKRSKPEVTCIDISKPLETDLR